LCIDALSIEDITPEARLAYDLIKQKITPDEQWYKKLWNINLPDAQDGFAILKLENGRFSLESKR